MLGTVQLLPLVGMVDMPLHSMYRNFLASFGGFNALLHPPKLIAC